MQTMKEAAANVAASARSGMEKTKATVQEKVDKMKAHDPVHKEMATERKEQRLNQAELDKMKAREQNAAVKQSEKMGGHGHYTATGDSGPYSTTTETQTYSSTGAHGQPTGAHQMNALPGHGTGHPTGQLIESVAGSHPIGSNTGTGRTKAHKRVDGNTQGYGTAGTYS